MKYPARKKNLTAFTEQCFHCRTTTGLSPQTRVFLFFSSSTTQIISHTLSKQSPESTKKKKKARKILKINEINWLILNETVGRTEKKITNVLSRVEKLHSETTKKCCHESND